MLKANGIEPAPERKRTTTWGTFLKAHWDQLAAIDFTTVEVWTKNGLMTFYLLFAMHLSTRRVKFVGCSPNPSGPLRALDGEHGQRTDELPGRLPASTDRIRALGRDSKFTAQFQHTLKSESVETVLLPPKSPNCNAWIERFFLSLKSEALDRMIFFGEAALRRATVSFLAHFDAGRNHQGLDHRIIDPGPKVGVAEGEIACRERLGGLLKYYQCQAA